MADLMSQWEEEETGRARARRQPLNPFDEPEVVALQTVSVGDSGQRQTRLPLPLLVSM